MNIVLHQPEIPANTGNIGRTCLATGTSLHLIEPLGFQLNEKALKRAGLDYWHDLDVRKHVDYEHFIQYVYEKSSGEMMQMDPQSPDSSKMSDLASLREEVTAPRIWYATTKAHQTYADVSYGPDDYIMFGKESAGIPEEILVDNEDRCIRIPMAADIRSLNLSNAVAIVLYEALRQQGFAGLEESGHLHRLSWGVNG